MATSKYYSETRTVTQIVTDAHIDLGIHDPDESLDSNKVTVGIRKLNNIIYQWKGVENYWVSAMRMWQRERASMTLVADQGSYDLMPATLAFTSGGTYEVAVGDTITGATSGSTATVVSVSVTSGTWAGGNAAGNLTVENQSAAFQSENLNVGSNTNVATIAADSTGSDLEILPPEEILFVSLKHTSSGSEIRLHPMNLEQYQSVTNKTINGIPTRYYYEKRKDVSGKLYLDIEPSSTIASAYTLEIVYRQPLEIANAGTNELDFPAHCYRALEFQLALDLAPGYNIKGDTYSEIRDNRDKPQDIEFYYQPGIDE